MSMVPEWAKIRWLKPGENYPTPPRRYQSQIVWAVNNLTRPQQDAIVYVVVENKRYRHCRIGRITLKEQA